MKINSLYVTQSAVISLADIPLEVKENIGKSFEPIFKSRKCFLHLYSAGYIVVYLAVYRRNLKNIDIKAERDILDLMHEIKLRINGKWKSKFGCNTGCGGFVGIQPSVT